MSVHPLEESCGQRSPFASRTSIRTLLLGMGRLQDMLQDSAAYVGPGGDECHWSALFGGRERGFFLLFLFFFSWWEIRNHICVLRFGLAEFSDGCRKCLWSVSHPCACLRSCPWCSCSALLCPVLFVSSSGQRPITPHYPDKSRAYPCYYIYHHLAYKNRVVMVTWNSLKACCNAVNLMHISTLT